MVRFYETLKEKGQELEIIFVSGDKGPDEFQERMPLLTSYTKHFIRPASTPFKKHIKAR